MESISDAWCSANHNALSAGLSEKKTKRLREAGRRGPTIMYSILKNNVVFEH